MSKPNPLISVCVPTHNMENGNYFFARLKASLEKQTYTNWELVVTSKGRMAENTNSAIVKATGDIIKILYMDDYFASPDALQHVADSVGNTWAVSGCLHTRDGREMINPHYPTYNDLIYTGYNTIGSPSVLAFKNDDPILFDERLSWLLDCDLYKRLYERYGEPKIINELDIAIGLGPHQTSNLMTDFEKKQEEDYVKDKHETWISA